MTSITSGPTTTPAPTAAPRCEANRRPVRFLEEVGRGPLVLDAGMGTRLVARGLDLRRDDPCLWNLDHPDRVFDVHRRDVAAGSRVLFTNTFGASRAWLTRLGRGGDVEAVDRAGVDLARRAAGATGFVIGDIGPAAADEPGEVAEQAVALLAAGVDGLILETFRFEPAIAALSELRSIGGTSPVPLLASLWQWPDAVEDAARRLVEAGADVVGVNCRVLGDMLTLVGRLAGAVACPLLVKPGAAPGDPEGASTPSAFAAAVPALIEHPVRLIGGCCGTTEAHVAAIAAAVRAIRRDPESRERRGTAP